MRSFTSLRKSDASRTRPGASVHSAPASYETDSSGLQAGVPREGVVELAGRRGPEGRARRRADLQRRGDAPRERDAGIRGGAEGVVLVAADARGDGEPVVREGEAVLGEDGPGARRQAVELEPVGVLVRRPSSARSRCRRRSGSRPTACERTSAAAGAAGLRLGEGEAPRVVGVGVGRGVVREGARRLERRPRSEGERRPGRRRASCRRSSRGAASASSPRRGCRCATTRAAP